MYNSWVIIIDKYGDFSRYHQPRQNDENEYIIAVNAIAGMWDSRHTAGIIQKTKEQAQPQLKRF